MIRNDMAHSTGLSPGPVFRSLFEHVQLVLAIRCSQIRVLQSVIKSLIKLKTKGHSHRSLDTKYHRSLICTGCTMQITSIHDKPQVPCPRGQSHVHTHVQYSVRHWHAISANINHLHSTAHTTPSIKASPNSQKVTKDTVEKSKSKSRLHSFTDCGIVIL